MSSPDTFVSAALEDNLMDDLDRALQDYDLPTPVARAPERIPHQRAPDMSNESASAVPAGYPSRPTTSSVRGRRYQLPTLSRSTARNADNFPTRLETTPRQINPYQVAASTARPAFQRPQRATSEQRAMVPLRDDPRLAVYFEEETTARERSPAFYPRHEEDRIPVELEAVCWRCGAVGHNRRQCQRPEIIFCSGCGTRGVLSKDCPCRRFRAQPASRSDSRRQRRQRRIADHKKAGECPLCHRK
ncbi:uncharacterized protein LOC115879639 [Sitophilus oryzae]|uniref:Uncharacterized protein LOC115879639 n=1 Tax=Sitophilus oryzae TaxID=7048 RepID=A0A6J2XLI9_SITOR|nr:uncharacterized protein LOC115879639 [Sitophilus oryzae]